MKPVVTMKAVAIEQQEMMEYKESIFRELPILILSVEQFGTLEVVEDYLLNKMAGKQDTSNQGIFQNIFKSQSREKKL